MKLRTIYNAAMLATLIAAVVSFAATNIDDIVLLTFFFSHGVEPWRVVIGQYIGFSALVAVSLIGYLLRFAIPGVWIGLLGLLPIIIGLKKLHKLRDSEDEITDVPVRSTLVVGAITFSNGGDNIGIYVPLFASTNFQRLTLTLVVFYVLLAVWCLAGYCVGNLPIIKEGTKRYGHALVPFALIALGVYILIHNHTLSLLRR